MKIAGRVWLIITTVLVPVLVLIVVKIIKRLTAVEVKSEQQIVDDAKAAADEKRAELEGKSDEEVAAESPVRDAHERDRVESDDRIRSRFRELLDRHRSRGPARGGGGDLPGGEGPGGPAGGGR